MSERKASSIVKSIPWQRTNRHQRAKEMLNASIVTTREAVSSR